MRAKRARNFAATPIFLHCHTHYFGNVHNYAQNSPTTPTKSQDIRTKTGEYTKVKLVPHPFCALYVVTYYDVSRGEIQDRGGTYLIFSGQLATMHVWGLCVNTALYKYAPILVCVYMTLYVCVGGGVCTDLDLMMKFLYGQSKCLIKVKFDRTFTSNARTPMYINYSRVCCVILQYMHRILPADIQLLSHCGQCSWWVLGASLQNHS